MELFSPLEQFEIWPLLSIRRDCYPIDPIQYYVVANISVAAFVCICGVISIFAFASSYKNILYYCQTNKDKQISVDFTSFFFVPSAWQNLIESIYNMISQIVFDLIGVRGEKYFPFIMTIFSFIFCSNLLGLIPFSFTVTTHLGTTIFLSYAIHNGLQVKLVQSYGLRVFSFFLPSNTTFYLALLLVPIEYVSYTSRPISLGVRLFINILAGHTLLKVIVGFSWSMMMMEGFQMVSFLIPLLILILLMGLELAVAFIQTYVFITLTCIYINDSESLH